MATLISHAEEPRYMKAALLVGGAGTRMRPLTYIVPKAMLPLAGKPLLERTLEYLRNHGIEDVVLCVAYLKRQIINYFEDGGRFGVRIQYAESDSPLGTGGQLRTAKPFLEGETFLAMNGDIFTSLPLDSLVAFHRESEAFLTIALKRFEFQMPYGRVVLDRSNRITRFDEKPAISSQVNAGIYGCEPGIFSFFPEKDPCSLEHDVFPAVIRAKRKVTGYRSDAYWGDIGKLSDYEKINAEAISNGGHPPKTAGDPDTTSQS